MSIYSKIAFVYVFFFYFSLLFNTVFNTKIYFIVPKLITLALAFATIAYHIFPSPVWDLSRLLNNVVTAENLNLGSYSEQVANNGLFVYDLFVMIAAKLGNPHILPAIIVFITFFSASCIVLLLKKQVGLFPADILLYMFLFPTLSNMENIFSGLRTSCSYTVIAFGLSFFIFYRKGKVGFLVLILTFLFGIGMHPAVWSYLFITVLCISNIKLKLLSILLIIWSAFSELIGTILTKLPMPFSYIGDKLTYYVGQSISDVRLLLISIPFILYLSVQLFFLYKNKSLLQEGNSALYMRYLTLVVSFALGSFFVFELLNRSMMMLAPLLLPFIVLERKTFTCNVFRLVMLGNVFFASLLLIYSLHTFSLYTQIY